MQLLWINLVTDGLPALALAIESAGARRPRAPAARGASAALMDRRFLAQVTVIGTLSAGVTLAAFAYELHAGHGVESARNAAFSVLVVEELLRALGARSRTRTLCEVGVLSNLRLAGVVVASLALQLVIQHTPLFEGVLRITPITAAQSAAWTALAAVPLAVLETRKALARPARPAGAGATPPPS